MKMSIRVIDSALRKIIITALAWLGLAGFADSVVTWQNWFEIGIMQHWRSVKEWVVAILLWWMPFQVPTWIIDYLFIGTIFTRGYSFDLFPVEFSPSPTILEYILTFLAWPVVFLYRIFYDTRRLIREHNELKRATSLGYSEKWRRFLRRHNALDALPDFFDDLKKDEERLERERRQYFSNLSNLVISFIGFIPFLFVTSTLLYEFG